MTAGNGLACIKCGTSSWGKEGHCMQCSRDRAAARSKVNADRRIRIKRESRERARARNLANPVDESQETTCNECGESKPLYEFPNDITRRNGKTTVCKTCTNARVNVRNKIYNVSDRGREAKRKYARSDKGKAVKKAWINDPANEERLKAYWSKYGSSEKGKAYRERYLATYGERHKARGVVNEEVRHGRMPRASELICVHCGRKAQQYHHYLGYEKEHWLDVEPVCRKCHTAIHHAPSNLS